MRLAYVTDSDYLWIENNREEIVSRQTVLKRLSNTPRFERSVPGDERCTTQGVSPIVSGTTDEDIRNAPARARAMELWLETKELGMGLPEPDHRFIYFSRRDQPPQLYRSRDELGAQASIVPADFDFKEKWLLRAYFPNGKMEKSCPEALDSYMSEEPRVSAKVPPEKVLGARRLAKAQLLYDYQGTLQVMTPSRREKRDADTECVWREGVEPVLVPIPHTRADVLLSSPNEH